MTTHTLEAAIPAIAAVVIATDAIKGTGLPADNQSEYPLAMTYVGDFQGGGDITQGLIMYHNVYIDILAPLEQGLQNIFPVFNAAIDELSTDLITEVVTDGGHFSNTIDTFESLTGYLLPDYPYGNIPMIGYRIVMNGVKLLNESIV